MDKTKGLAEADRGADLDISGLDEMTHAELQLLYKESTATVLFAKALQWKTVGATLVVYILLIGIAKFVTDDPRFFKGLEAIILLATPASILILVIYQIWQHTEQQKLSAIAARFSSIFRDIRRIKVRFEANIHRYTLLAFMILIILLGSTVAFTTVAALRY